MKDGAIKFLDHVALRVKDMEASANWYEKVLGLKRKQVPEWDPFPIFLLAGETGIALFPAKGTVNSTDKKIDHFAFRVDRTNFEMAKEKYEELDLEFTIQDHHYFRSMYTRDPDGNKVELTCLIREDFFDTPQ